MFNTCEECRAKFLLYPETFHPDIITKLLHIIPTEKEVKGEIRKGYKGRSILIKRSKWFLISDYEIKSVDLRDHLLWLIQKLKKIGDIPYYLQQKIALLPSLKKSEYNVIMVIYCTWFATQDHGGPIITPHIMHELSKFNVELTLDVYFLYEISTISSLMEAAKILGIGEKISFPEWRHILSFIKIIHNIPPNILGIVYDNGDFFDDDKNYICNIKDYIL